MTLMYNSGKILWGEIRCWSLLGSKGLISVEQIDIMLYVSVQYYITDEVKMYDSLHLHTVYSAADNIPWA